MPNLPEDRLAELLEKKHEAVLNKWGRRTEDVKFCIRCYQGVVLPKRQGRAEMKIQTGWPDILKRTSSAFRKIANEIRTMKSERDRLIAEYRLSLLKEIGEKCNADYAKPRQKRSGMSEK